MEQRFYYINQLRTPSFPIGLVKTKSDVIIPFKFRVLKAKVAELFETLNFKRDIQKKHDRNRKIENKTLLKK